MANVFDNLMIHTCDIKEKSFIPADAYNQPDQTKDTLLSAWPCRLTTMTGGHEYRVDKEYGVNRYRIFMRLPTGITLTNEHWLTVHTPSRDYEIDVEAVNEASGLGHHIEAIGQVVQP